MQHSGVRDHAELMLSSSSSSSPSPPSAKGSNNPKSTSLALPSIPPSLNIPVTGCGSLACPTYPGPPPPRYSRWLVCPLIPLTLRRVHPLHQPPARSARQCLILHLHRVHAPPLRVGQGAVICAGGVEGGGGLASGGPV